MKHLLIFSLTPLILTLGIIPLLPNIDAEESSIPSWIKTTVEFWVNGDVSDQEFIDALQFLVESGVLTIPQQTTMLNDYSKFNSILFTNVNIFDGIHDGLQNDMYVHVMGNKIQTISENNIPVNKNTAIIDGTGLTLMPGLIDIHSHLAIVKDVRDLENMMLDEIAIRSQITANDWLMDGYTTVRDVGGPVFGLKRVIDSGDVVGPRIFPSGAMISQTAGHGDWRAPNDPNPSLSGIIPTNLERMGFFSIADGVPNVLATTRQNLMQGATQIKIMAGGGGSSSYDPIDTCQYTFNEILGIVSATDDWNTYVTAHTFQPRCM